MGGIIGFRNLAAEPDRAVTVTDETATGSADSAHPVQNVIDGSTATFFRRWDSTTLTIRLVVEQGPNIGMCIAGAMGVEALIGTPLPHDDPSKITMQVKVGTSAGASDIYSGYRRIVPSGTPSEVHAPSNAFLIFNEMTTALAVAMGGGWYSVGNVYFDFVFNTGGAAADWRVFQLGVFSGFHGKVEPSRAFGVDDESVVQLSYSGVEFVSRKMRKRVISATLIDLETPQIFGGTVGPLIGGGASQQITASVSALNAIAGKSAPVVFVPRSNIGTSNYATPLNTAGRDWKIDNQAQAEIMWGFLSQPLQANEQARVATSPSSDKSSTWKAPFQLTEAHNGLD